jgi:hypothetical protein
MSNSSRTQILVLSVGSGAAGLLERALAYAHREHRVPHEIHLIGDARVLSLVEREVLREPSTRFAELCARLGISRDDVVFNRRTLHLVQADVHGSRGCGAAVDEAMRLLRQVRADAGAELTVLLAADAALCAVVLHAALQIAGRPGDRLLVECPIPPSRAREPGAASRDQMMEFPLLLCPDAEHPAGTYTEAVRQRQVERRRLEQPDVLRIDPAQRIVAVGETTVRLPALQFFWVYYLGSTPGERFPLSELSALLAKPPRQPVHLVQKLADARTRSLPSDLQRTFARLFPHATDKFDAMLLRSCGPHPGLPSTISKINARLRRALGRGAAPYLIEGGRGSGGYRLSLPSDCVELVAVPDPRRG